IGREAAGLLDAIAGDEGICLDTAELVADLVAKPALNVPGVVLQQLLRHLRIGIELVHGNALHAGFRHAGLGPILLLADPPGGGFVVGAEDSRSRPRKSSRCWRSPASARSRTARR